MMLLIAFYVAVLFITAWTLTSVLGGSMVAPHLNVPPANAREPRR
jgi:hypothetical protein